MPVAVIASEDQRFLLHHGFDFDAIEKAAKHNQRSKRKHGASTISQQTAKNVFLWPGRSWTRKGLEASIIDKVAELNLKEIVYISCNPSTFARDVKLFSEKGYVLKKLQAVDMFPQTSHIECVGLIERR